MRTVHLKIGVPEWACIHPQAADVLQKVEAYGVSFIVWLLFFLIKRTVHRLSLVVGGVGGMIRKAGLLAL